jgi:small-conductance mechanosensitive channel/CRP-like cAMP-binding protein
MLVVFGLLGSQQDAWSGALSPELSRAVQLALRTGLWVAAAALFNQFMRYVVYDRLVARALGGPVPDVLKTLTSVIVYMLVATAIVGLVYERSVTAFLAALGASGVVLGFALRSLIADVFTGLAINLDRSFIIGDWVQVNEGVSGLVIGKIEDIGWRCTTLVTEEQTHVVIPNGMLGLERMVNITRPPGATRYEFSVTVEFSVPPARVKRVLLAALQSLVSEPGFDPARKPVVLISGTSSLGVEYLLRYWIFPWDPISPTTAEDTVYGTVLRHLHTAGIGLAYPKRDLYTAEMPTRQFDGHRITDLALILGNTPLFKPVRLEDLEVLARKMERRHMQAGEILVHEGDRGESLFILIEGLLEVRLRTDAGEKAVGHIGPGECFGEMSLLTGERRAATIVGAVESIVYEVAKEPMSELMAQRPELADALATLLAERQLGTELALHDEEGRDSEAETDGFARQLVSRMREFFELRPPQQRGD